MSALSRMQRAGRSPTARQIQTGRLSTHSDRRMCERSDDEDAALKGLEQLADSGMKSNSVGRMAHSMPQGYPPDAALAYSTKGRQLVTRADRRCRERPPPGLL